MFIGERKLIISIVSITQSCFKVPKGVRLNPTYIFIKIPNKGELQQIALNHLSDIGFWDFIKICEKCTAEPYYFLVNKTTLQSDNPLRFRKKIFWNKYIRKSWQLMVRLRMKNYINIILEKLEKYLLYHQEKLASWISNWQSWQNWIFNMHPVGTNCYIWHHISIKIIDISY